MSLNNLKTEVAVLLKNSDVMTTTERGVTTQTDEVVLTNATTTLINRTNIKNIRSITVGTTLLKYGKDYTVDYDFMDTTIKCKITFTTAQTGTTTIVYDYGTDRIFTDRPRSDLSLNSYPRISIEDVTDNTQPLSLGGTDFITNKRLQVTVFSENQEYTESKIETINSLIKTNAKLFYYSPFIYPASKGPINKTPNRNDIIISKNIDLISQFEVN